MKLERKIAVVTGAASGIGLALAQALSERGCRLVLADLDVDRARAAAQDIGGEEFAFRCDVRDRTAGEALADAAQARHGDIDLVFNNAGVMPATGPDAIADDPRELDWVLSVNVVGTWNGCSVFGRRLAARPEPGWVINTASEHALGMQHVGQAFYTASKHAILGLSAVMRTELPPRVGISVLCPGLVQSQLWAARYRAQPLGADTTALLPIAEAVMSHGTPAVEVARQAVAGVEPKISHCDARHVAVRCRPTQQRRQRGLDSQAPYDEGSERYDVPTVIRTVLAGIWWG